MKKISLLLFLVVVLTSLVGCAQENNVDENTAEGESNDNTTQQSEGTTDEEVEKEKIVAAVSDEYPPMEFRDENNELVGFDIDFAAALSEEMGVEIEFKPTGWDGIFVGLQSDKYDCIISATSITPGRMEAYDFSKPYLANGQVIVVKAGDASIKSIEDLAGKKVGVQFETTADNAAKKVLETTEFELVQFPDIIQTFQDLKNDRLDCIVVDYAVAMEYVSKDAESFEITTTQLTNEPIGITFKKGNTELKERFDNAITALQENGKLKEISIKWLGDDYVSNIDEEVK